MRVAVVIPCLNEAPTIGGVVADFRRALPDARVYVVDNASTDATASVAAAAGATVFRESRRGKGHATRKAFRTIEADAYLLVDGDGTYPAEDAPRLLQPIADGVADVVTGSRLNAASARGFHPVNRLGNRLLLAVLNTIFRTQVSDLLTGYRAMSREFIRRSPILSSGFELETELTILALARDFRTLEVPIRLASRPPGSHSKIRVLGDGLRILGAIFALLRDYRPLSFFGGIGLAAMLAGLGPGLFVTVEFLQTHEVRVPSAVLATGLEIVGSSLVLTGVMLTALTRRFREIDYQLAGIEQDLERLARPGAGAPPRDR